MIKSRGEKLMLLKNNNWRNIDGLLAAAAATEYRKYQRQLEIFRNEYANRSCYCSITG